jgi:hypothetical protein
MVSNISKFTLISLLPMYTIYFEMETRSSNRVPIATVPATVTTEDIVSSTLVAPEPLIEQVSHVEPLSRFNTRFVSGTPI